MFRLDSVIDLTDEISRGEKEVENFARVAFLFYHQPCDGYCSDDFNIGVMRCRSINFANEFLFLSVVTR